MRSPKSNSLLGRPNRLLLLGNLGRAAQIQLSISNSLIDDWDQKYGQSRIERIDHRELNFDSHKRFCTRDFACWAYISQSTDKFIWTHKIYNFQLFPKLFMWKRVQVPVFNAFKTVQFHLAHFGWYAAAVVSETLSCLISLFLFKFAALYWINETSNKI